MKTKNHIGIYILLAFLFIILYIILAAKPLGKEYHFSPEWKKSITGPATPDNNPSGSLIYYKLGQSIGYFTENGKITVAKTFPSKASISSDYFAMYNSQANNVVFYNNKDQEQGSLQIDGYPFFEEDRIFVFLPGGASFAKCGSDGKVLWINENTISLTAFSSKKNFTATGYADGTIRVLNNDTGIENASFSPGGSDYKVILGLDVSSDGTLIASISGHDKQRFVLTKTEGNQPKIIFHKYLDSDLIRRTVVRFCDDDKHILYNYEGYLGIYNIDLQKNTEIKIDKNVIAIEETPSLFFVLGNKDNEYTVYIIEKTDTLEGSFTFIAESAFIKTEGNDLYVGQDTTISKVKITKE